VVEGLTEREKRLLNLLIEPCASTDELAKRMGCRPRTIKQYFRVLFGKFGIRDGVKRVKLAVAWYRLQHSPEQTK
jgi:DNA-binding CsgD family transcriptional regulator